MRPTTLTPLELEIMHILWQQGPSTVAEVQPQLKAQLAYTTVMTMLGVLFKKGKVKRTQQGRAFVYRAAVTRERATGSALTDVLERVFGGSADALVLSLVETRGLTADDLTRLSKAVAEAEAARPPKATRNPKPAAKKLNPKEVNQ